MSTNIFNLLSHIRAGRPVGMTKPVRAKPRDFLMYGRHDGATIGQHLDEFDTWKDDKGRSFDQVMIEGLLVDDKALMPPPPKPTTSKANSAKSTTSKANSAERDDVDVSDYFARLENHHITVAKERLVENPEYKAALQKEALKKSAKRKRVDESSDMRAKNAKVLDQDSNGGPAKAPRVAEEGSARKRPFQRYA
jgi:hypothetical protein